MRRHAMGKTMIHRACLILAVACALSLLSVSPCFAADVSAEGRTVVRIGFSDYPGFTEKTSDGGCEGYAPDLLDEIARYTDWDYEYINDTWMNLLERLKTGDIDFVCVAQKTEDRVRDYLFSDFSIGSESSYLYTRNDETRYYYADYDHFDGMLVGFLDGSFQNSRLAQCAEQYGFTYRSRMFATEDEAYAALDAGEVDAVSMGSIAALPGRRFISRFGADPFYFMTGKNNADVLATLNFGLGMVKSSSPFLESELFEKHFTNRAVGRELALTREQKELIDRYGSVRVGVLAQNSPYSYVSESGEAKGIIVDLFNLISEKSGLGFTFEFLEADETASDYLCSEGKVVVGFGDSDAGDLTSVDLVSSELSLIGKTNRQFGTDDELVVAITSSELSDVCTLTSRYPSFSFSRYATAEACIEAAESGKTDAALVDALIAREILQSPRYRDLETIPALSCEHALVAMVAQNGGVLQSLLKESMDALSESEVLSVVSHNTTGKTLSFDFEDFIGEYRIALVLIVLAIASIIAAGLVVISMKQRNLKQVRKLNAQMVEAVASAERANKAKSTFLSSMSHEMRTPLNVVLGLTRLAKGQKEDPEAVGEYLDDMENAEMLLMAQINDVLDMAKIENAALELNPEPLFQREFLSYIDSLIAPLYREKNIDCTLATDLAEDFAILVDRKRFTQIFFNLLSNAIKYTPEGGSIRFEVFTHVDDGDHANLKFVVSDTGIGISRELQEHLFEPFVRGEGVAVQEVPGAGLGLALVKQLVRAMGGSINVESGEGAGTTIVVECTAPIAKTEKEECPALLPKDYSALKGKRVLVCEDHPINARIVAKILEKEGLSVEVAIDGLKGVEAYRSHPSGYFDAIILDIRMPNMDGWEAAREMRCSGLADSETVPIIAMTANAFDDDRRKSYACGMNEHLAKPLEPQLLLDTLVKLLDETDGARKARI